MLYLLKVISKKLPIKMKKLLTKICKKVNVFVYARLYWPKCNLVFTNFLYEDTVKFFFQTFLKLNLDFGKLDVNTVDAKTNSVLEILPALLVVSP